MARKRSIRDEYPDHPASHGQKAINYRGGCKVYWETFATLEEANLAAAWARTEAEIRQAEGYDSGYCTPGKVEKTGKGFEVCFL
jgi:hypothetical protein